MKKGMVSVAFLATLFLTSCMNMDERVNGSGNIKTETRRVGQADKIKLTGDMDVVIEQGPSSVKVEGDDNVLQYVETNVNDNWLEIKTKDNFDINTSKPVRVYVTTPEINELKVTGSGNIKSSEKFSTNNNTAFETTGSGDIEVAINSPKVEAHISGSGNLHISGETKDVEIHITGSGNFDGNDLKAENADVSIAGSGDANVFADNKLKASVAGSGNVKYKGNATVDSHIAGSGAVSKE